MITLLVGHRGVGKSSLLSRVDFYFKANKQNVLCFDLDAEIEKRTQVKISDYFIQFGESAFRQIEQDILKDLIAEISHQEPVPSCFIALGAGYCGELPQNAAILWVRRPSDEQGRIFLDRPKLNPQDSDLLEFNRRKAERDLRFSKWADETWFMQEGFQFCHQAEQDFILNQISGVGGATTVLCRQKDMQSFLAKRKNWGVQYWELRDDLLAQADIKGILEMFVQQMGSLSQQHILYSLRKSEGIEQLRSMLSELKLHGLNVDWALELGADVPSEASIVSLHDRGCGQPLADCQNQLLTKGRGRHLKLAVEIHNFAELWQGHQWQQEDPQSRSFLPRSLDGRWAWYRLLMKNQCALNFWREDEGSSLDQPLLGDWLRSPQKTSAFAAILGDPVDHSLSCAEHFEFFKMLAMPVLRIQVAECEWESALETLTKLGLRFAAVTSPLKKRAFASSQVNDLRAIRFQAVNTLVYDQKQQCWVGCNTDYEGARKGFAEVSQKAPVVIWGGGGTLEMLREVFLNASCYSAQSGAVRAGFSEAAPEVLVWAAGPGGDVQKIPAQFKPHYVADLSYSENSPARAYAKKVKANYISGLKMFRAQALKQQDFWRQYAR